MAGTAVKIPENGYLSVADTAKLVREQLNKHFPDTKFSVRSSRYSGGASITVYWTDGPSEPDVRKLTDVYGGKGFDGMIDMSYYKSTWLMPDGSATYGRSSGTLGSAGSTPGYEYEKPHPDAVLVHMGADSVGLQREMSPATEVALSKRIADFAGEPYEHNRHYDMQTFKTDDGTMEFATDSVRGEYGSTLLHQLFHSTSFAPSEWTPDWRKPKPKDAPRKKRPPKRELTDHVNSHHRRSWNWAHTTNYEMLRYHHEKMHSGNYGRNYEFDTDHTHDASEFPSTEELKVS